MPELQATEDPNSLPVYPLRALYHARDAFWHRWQKALSKDRAAQRVYEAHYHSPPNVFLLNTEPYPFAEADTFYPSPDILLLRGREPSIPLIKKRTREVLEMVPVVKEKPRKKPRLTDRQIGLLTEKAIDSGCGSSVSSKPGDSVSIFFNCDACDEAENMSYTEAEKHVQSTGHVSCSEYMRLAPTKTEEEADEEVVIVEVEDNNKKNTCSSSSSSSTSSGLVQLAAPRVIAHIGESQHGWNVGDHVVMCPSCRLILPDKILAAFHHQTLHPGNQPVYSWGRVLSSQTLDFSCTQLVCTGCNTTFANLWSLVQHWMDRRLACSPFAVTETGCAPQIIHLQCAVCGLQSESTVVQSSASTSGTVLSPEALANATKRAHFAGATMLNHLWKHCRRPRLCRQEHSMRFRLICPEPLPPPSGQGSAGGRCTLPPPSKRSHCASLLFAVREAQKQQALLRTYRKAKKQQLRLASEELSKLQSATEVALASSGAH